MPIYPTPQHEEAALLVARFFNGIPEVDALLLTASCARGKTAPDSDLDFAALVRPEVLATERTELERRWEEFYASREVFRELERVGKYSHVDVDFVDGCFTPGFHGWTSGPDEFELEVGNVVAYSIPMFEHGRYYQELRDRWLPYYDERLRARRLAMVRRYCLNNLDHVEPYIGRGLYFQAFDRLYNAYREFLQALFISRRTYPIAYDKWIREQVEGMLELPELYPELPRLFEIERFESDELVAKADRVRSLLSEYVPG